MSAPDLEKLRCTVLTFVRGGVSSPAFSNAEAALDTCLQATHEAAFKAGQERMREKAAAMSGEHLCVNTEDCHCPFAIEEAVRALPIAEDK